MQKLVFIIVILTLFSGCASIGGAKRYQVENTIVSEAYPSATFVVSNEFQYYDSSENVGTSSTDPQTTTSASNYSNEFFLFSKPTGAEPQRFFAVQFLQLNKPRWTWTRDFEWTGRGVVSGSINTAIGEMEVFTTFASMADIINGFGLPLSSFSSEPCAIVSTFRQIPSGMARYKYLMHYIEPIDCERMNQFAYGGGRLTRTGERRIDMHLRNASQDTLIVSGD